MDKANLEHDGNDAVLKFITNFGDSASIKCKKADTEIFRLSFTGANEILVHRGTVKEIYDTAVVIDTQSGQRLHAERISKDVFEVGQVIFATEYYSLYMERSGPSFVASFNPIPEPRLLFINVDCLDGGGNVMKRYRVSPYNSSYRIVDDV